MNSLFTGVVLYLYQYPDLYSTSICFLLVVACCYAEYSVVLPYNNIQLRVQPRCMYILSSGVLSIETDVQSFIVI